MSATFEPTKEQDQFASDLATFYDRSAVIRPGEGFGTLVFVLGQTATDRWDDEAEEPVYTTDSVWLVCEDGRAVGAVGEYMIWEDRQRQLAAVSTQLPALFADDIARERYHAAQDDAAADAREEREEREEGS